MKHGLKHMQYRFVVILGDPEVTANINCKSRSLPNTDRQMTVQICGNFVVTQYVSLDPFHILIPYIKWSKTSWAYIFLCQSIYKQALQIAVD